MMRQIRSPGFTLTAGPAEVYPRVLAALSQPVTHYYDPLFLERFRRTEAKVGQVFGTTSEIILLQGEAVLGLEAAARSLVRPGMSVLNLVSGVYGHGMSLWLKSFGAELHELITTYDEAIDPDEVGAYLDAHPEIELLCVVHCEASSGTLNDCSRIGPIARAHDVVTLVDCVASLGGMPVDPDRWQLDVCVAAPQKCLGAPPGMSLIAVSPQAWAAIERNPQAPRDSFLSLLDWRDHWHGQGRFPYTPSVSSIYGVEAACDVFLEEGREAVFARHEMSARVCRAGVLAMGLRLWPAREAIMPACVTAITVPAGLDQAAVCAYVRERYDVMISGSEGAGNLVRIGHVGPTASAFHPVVGLAALGRSLADLGVDVRIGDGVDAALAVLAESRRAPS
jgi:pyridoxamine---pyruvate transaminase